jgi:hypothetical protein
VEDQLPVGRCLEREAEAVQKISGRIERKGGQSRTRPGRKYHSTEYCYLNEAAEGEGYEQRSAAVRIRSV